MNILIFTIATIINVIISTIRSITTIKCGKWISATTNALCYGFYPLIVMLTAKDTVDIVINMLITAIANFVCVWIIKLVEEKAKKDKLWKVEVAVPKENGFNFHYDLNLGTPIPHNFNYLGKYCVFNCYCETQNDTKRVVDIAKQYKGKISAYESKKLGV